MFSMFRRGPSLGEPGAITTDELLMKVRSGEVPYILDVREVLEWRQGRIPGGHLIPLGSLPQRLAEVPKDKEIVTVCRSGGRSLQAARILVRSGYANVKNMTGGMLSWRGETDKG